MTNTIAKPRLLYFDVLKGIAIFMVVMGHVLTMCIRDIDRAPLFKFIGELHMPLFFFISGWFTMSFSAQGQMKRPRIGSRAKQLLIPMVVVSTLWIFYFPYSGLESPLVSTFPGLWLNEWKNGYWFTLILFEIIVVYSALYYLLRKPMRPCVMALIGLGVWLVLVVIAIVFAHTEISGFAGLTLLATYWPAFFVGALASRYRERFEALLTSGTFTTIAILVGCFTLYYICWWWEFGNPMLFGISEFHLIIARPIFHICLAVVALAIFQPAVNRACNDGSTPRWVRVWTYLGANSLGIYLLHYFFLFPLGSLREMTLAMNLGFVPLLLISSLVALVVIVVVCAVIRILAISPVLSFLLTGKKP
ncbi:MAG: acyltransferase [Muribaculaceae bacterium]|nr:acyltransferase [Muribaculaceae bacterium]